MSEEFSNNTTKENFYVEALLMKREVGRIGGIPGERERFKLIEY